MATSRSTESTQYIAGASIFSGRPDPIWIIDSNVGGNLRALWESLPPYSGPVQSAPALGYRGCYVRDPKDCEWFAYQAVVTMKRKGKIVKRRDDDRLFERMLLRSAPPDAIPPQISDAIFE
jgi:hypothetical protein